MGPIIISQIEAVMSCPETVGKKARGATGTNYLNLFFFMFSTMNCFPLNIVFDSPSFHLSVFLSSFLPVLLNSLKTIRIF